MFLKKNSKCMTRRAEQKPKCSAKLTALTFGILYSGPRQCSRDNSIYCIIILWCYITFAVGKGQIFYTFVLIYLITTVRSPETSLRTTVGRAVYICRVAVLLLLLLLVIVRARRREGRGGWSKWWRRNARVSDERVKNGVRILNYSDSLGAVTGERREFV